MKFPNMVTRSSSENICPAEALMFKAYFDPQFWKYGMIAVFGI